MALADSHVEFDFNSPVWGKYIVIKCLPNNRQGGVGWCVSDDSIHTHKTMRAHTTGPRCHQ